MTAPLAMHSAALLGRAPHVMEVGPFNPVMPLSLPPLSLFLLITSNCSRLSFCSGVGQWAAKGAAGDQIKCRAWQALPRLISLTAVAAAEPATGGGKLRGACPIMNASLMIPGCRSAGQPSSQLNCSPAACQHVW